MPMARKTVKKKSVAAASAAPAKTVEVKEVEKMAVVEAPVVVTSGKKLRDEHHAFSHVMYFLFLLSITVATFFTFQSFVVLANSPDAQYFHVVFAILMLCWSFLFWEFGHRIHIL
jgi:hypothetical protein